MEGRNCAGGNRAAWSVWFQRISALVICTGQHIDLGLEKKRKFLGCECLANTLQALRMNCETLASW